MTKPPFRPATFVAIGLLAFAAGCSSTDKTEAKKAEADEYVYVTVTGSNIPKRIKKSDIAAGKVEPEVAAQLVDKEEFAKSLRPAPMKGN